MGKILIELEGTVVMGQLNFFEDRGPCEDNLVFANAAYEENSFHVPATSIIIIGKTSILAIRNAINKAYPEE